jgi:sugar lactone lactonase YvrE
LAALILALSAAPASASQGLYDFFGHTGAGAGQFAAGLEEPRTEDRNEKFEPGPAGIAVNDTSGDIYVADRVNNRVQQFDSEYNFIRAWGVDVVASGEDDSGTTGFEVCKANPPSNDVCQAGVASGLAGGMSKPAGIAVDQANQNVYVMDVANRRVNQYDPTGTFVRSWGGGVDTGASSFEICTEASTCQAGVSGSFGGAFGSTNEPNHVAIAPGGPYAGDLFVADAGNQRMQVFDPTTGAFVAAFGKDVLQSGTETFGKRVCIAALANNVCKAGSSPVVNNIPPANSYGFGEFHGSAGANSRPSTFAVDANGSIYVPGVTNYALQKYSPDLGSESDFAPYLCTRLEVPGTTEPQPTGCSEVGVDPQTNDVYVAYGIRGEKIICAGIAEGCVPKPFVKERAIARLDSAGSEPPLEEGILEGFGVRYINGIAVDGSVGVPGRSGHVFLTVNGPEQRVDVLFDGTPPDFEFAPIDPAEVKAHEITAHLTINPHGNSVDTSYQFETLIQGGVWKPYPLPPASVGNGTSPVAIDAVVANLRANTKYRIRLAVKKGDRRLSPEQTFTTPPSAPTVETGEARWSGPPSSGPSLTFFATVDDENLPVHYYFEYGADASYGARVPLFETGSYAASQEPFVGRQTVNGLDPAGSYHYRIVARSASGASVGADREVGPSQSGGRFAEQVSPADKGVGNVRESPLSFFFRGESLQAAASGDRLAYQYEYGNPDATAGGEMLEFAKRGSSAWATEQLVAASNAPPEANPVLGATQGFVMWLSPELDCSFMQARNTVNSETPPADVENYIWHLYRGDDAGNFKMITPTPLSGNQSDPVFRVLGAASDCSRVVFQTKYRLLPSVPEVIFLGNPHFYEWEAGGGPDGTLRPVDVRPDGSVPSGGASMGLDGNFDVPPNNAVSRPDGDRAFFVATSNAGGDSGNAAIFVRESAAGTTDPACLSSPRCTVDVSQSQTATPNTDTTVFQMASADGSHVFFKAMAGLAANSPASPIGNSLYDYDVDTGELRDLTPDSNPADSAGAVVEGVFGTGDDGSYIYFATKGQLIAGKGRTYLENNDSLNGFDNVYLSHNGALSYVGSITKKDAGRDEGGLYLGAFVQALASNVGPKLRSRVTPDGRHLLFVSGVNLDPPYDSAGKREIYRYSADDSTISCISCRPDGDPPTVDNEGIHINENSLAVTYHSRSITTDGARVFFTSSEELVEGGTGEKNAYEWHDGALTLLARGGEVLDAGADGNDVFVRTAEPLVPQDRDTAPDIYDLRIDGGFAYFPPAPCDPLTENSCQGTPPAAPAAGADPASSTFSGPGNPAATVTKPPKCKKGQVRRKGRCIKRHKSVHKRAAKRNRGGSR